MDQAGRRPRAHHHGARPAAQVREATAPIYSGFVRLHGTAERARAERWAARQAARASLPERHGGVLAWLGLGLGLGVG